MRYAARRFAEREFGISVAGASGLTFSDDIIIG
jgi:hypothetical protein